MIICPFCFLFDIILFYQKNGKRKATKSLKTNKRYYFYFYKNIQNTVGLTSDKIGKFTSIFTIILV